MVDDLALHGSWDKPVAIHQNFRLGFWGGAKPGDRTGQSSVCPEYGAVHRQRRDSLHARRQAGFRMFFANVSSTWRMAASRCRDVEFGRFVGGGGSAGFEMAPSDLVAGEDGIAQQDTRAFRASRNRAHRQATARDLAEVDLAQDVRRRRSNHEAVAHANNEMEWSRAVLADVYLV
jgi:hypothetical protein